jgi:hypothetical protein
MYYLEAVFAGSMIVGAALSQLDRLHEALDAAEPSFDVLPDLPNMDDTVAGP